MLPEGMVQFARDYLAPSHKVDIGDIQRLTLMTSTICTMWAIRHRDGDKSEAMRMMSQCGLAVDQGSEELSLTPSVGGNFGEVSSLLASRVALIDWGS